jgi:hypothetical protein
MGVVSLWWRVVCRTRLPTLTLTSQSSTKPTPQHRCGLRLLSAGPMHPYRARGVFPSSAACGIAMWLLSVLLLSTNSQSVLRICRSAHILLEVAHPPDHPPTHPLTTLFALLFVNAPNHKDTIMCAREAFTLYGRGQGTVSGDDLFTALRCCSVNPTLAAVKVRPVSPSPPISARVLLLRVCAPL